MYLNSKRINKGRKKCTILLENLLQLGCKYKENYYYIFFYNLIKLGKMQAILRK